MICCAYNLCKQLIFRCATSVAGPEPAEVWEAFEKKAGAAAFQTPARQLCTATALPSPDRRQHVPETLVNMKREREVSRGEEICSTLQFSIYSPMECGSFVMLNELVPPYVEAKMPVG